MKTWWTGTVLDRDHSIKRFAVQAPTEEEARKHVTQYGYEVQTIERSLTYVPSGDHVFRCVPDSREFKL